MDWEGSEKLVGGGDKVFEEVQNTPQNIDSTNHGEIPVETEVGNIHTFILQSINLKIIWHDSQHIFNEPSDTNLNTCLGKVFYVAIVLLCVVT